MKNLFRYHKVKLLTLLVTIGIAVFDWCRGGIGAANSFLLFTVPIQAVNMWYMEGLRKFIKGQYIRIKHLENASKYK